MDKVCISRMAILDTCPDISIWGLKIKYSLQAILKNEDGRIESVYRHVTKFPKSRTVREAQIGPEPKTDDQPSAKSQLNEIRLPGGFDSPQDAIWLRASSAYCEFETRPATSRASQDPPA